MQDHLVMDEVEDYVALQSSPCPDEFQLRQDLARFGKWLYRLGFMPGTSGNLSVRLDSDRLLVTPTGASKYLLRPCDMVTVDLDGRLISGSRHVTSEIGMHLAVYRSRPDMNAVVHSHPPIATAFACSGRALDEMISQEGVVVFGSIPLAPYATTGTPEVAASIEPLIPGHQAILLASHGAVTYGDTLLDAFLKMETLEHLAHVHLVAAQLGPTRALAHEQVLDLLRARERYIQNIQ